MSIVPILRIMIVIMYPLVWLSEWITKWIASKKQPLSVSREEVFFDEYHQRYAADLIEYAIKLRDDIPSYWK